MSGLTEEQVLHTISENEGTTKGTSNVFRQLMENQLKIDPELLRGKKIFGSGDQLSMKLMRIAQFILDEEAPGKNMDYLEGMIGLFHLRLAVMHMIMRYVLFNPWTISFGVSFPKSQVKERRC